jgi:alkanesulfonate monooxygenase SsuD/methylene tetrahydromethanopterin reductase-like flavin-dependent oxidoreductase (luciferase family)
MGQADSPLHVGIALEGAGWHPGAWREPDARPAELFSARYWTDLVEQAEHGLADFVTFEDSFSPQPAQGSEREGWQAQQVRGRLDAVLIAARVAPVTSAIGLIPTVIATHTEPFHISKAIATLDYVSTGRAGVRVRVSGRPDEARHFGRRSFPGQAGAGADAAELLAEAADYIEVTRRLWDSWEDDAEIRDVATGRFIDRDKLHYIDFDGHWFNVKGPSITPRPPQGQPLVCVLGHGPAAYELIGRSADVGFVTPRDQAEASAIVASVRAAQAAAGRADERLPVLADLLVYLDDEPSAATARRARLDDAAGREYAGDALAFTGTPAQLADLLTDWRTAGLSGFRLRPAALPHDLTQVTDGLLAELRRRGLIPDAYRGGTLRERFGLPRPASRYAAA